MNPLTPDHHFYIDQGTNARVRLVLVAIGRKLVEGGRLDDAEDVMFLRYNELRVLMANPEAFDARALVSERRDERERGVRRPPARVDRHRHGAALDFPYYTLWGFPEKFHREPSETAGRDARPGRLAGRGRGPARLVASLDEFDQVQEGEVLVCQMTNPPGSSCSRRSPGSSPTPAGSPRTRPSWRASSGSRRSSAPPTRPTRIKTGDRVRVNGATGVVVRFEP